MVLKFHVYICNMHAWEHYSPKSCMDGISAPVRVKSMNDTYESSFAAIVAHKHIMLDVQYFYMVLRPKSL